MNNTFNKVFANIIIKKIASDPTNIEYEFDSSLTSGERKYVHNMARRYGLKSKSSGVEPNRCIKIFKNKSHNEGEEIWANTILQEKSKDLVNSLLARQRVATPERNLLVPYTDPSQSLPTCSPNARRVGGTRLLSGIPSQPRPGSFKRSSMLDRNLLPIAPYQGDIVNAVIAKQVVIINGETGCGKTTQVPQYILDYAEKDEQKCRIICSLPRRVAVMAVSERVAYERGEPLGTTVGYQVRLEANFSPNSNLIFCTAGVLLASLLAGDDLLENVTHLIIDEFHVRDKLTDFSLIILQEALRKFPYIRIILMSATMDVEKITKYFEGIVENCPVISVPGGLHEVEDIFMEEMLPTFPKPLVTSYTNNEETQPDVRLTDLDIDAVESTLYSQEQLDMRLILQVLVVIHSSKEPGGVLIFLPGYDDIMKLKNTIIDNNERLERYGSLRLFLLHSKMQNKDQQRVFQRLRQNQRKIVLATNIAETSITIEDIAFVVDCGRVKEKSYNAVVGTSSLTSQWISQSCAAQRKGRAGRTKDGVCFHLYTRNMLDNMPQYPVPQILREPLEELCLQAKYFSPSVPIANFLQKAIEPPNENDIKIAVENLKLMDALDPFESLSELGRELANLAIEPKYGKMIIYAIILKCLDPVLIIASCLSVGEPFKIPTNTEFKQIADSKRMNFSADSLSDHMGFLQAFKAWSDITDESSSRAWCDENFINYQSMSQTAAVRKQILDQLVKRNFVTKEGAGDIKYVNTNSENWPIVKAALTAGLYPNLAKLDKKKKVLECRKVEKAFIQGGSALRGNAGKTEDVSRAAAHQRLPSDWVIYQDLVQHHNQNYICTCTMVSAITICLFAGPMRLPIEPFAPIYENEPQLIEEYWDEDDEAQKNNENGQCENQHDEKKQDDCNPQYDEICSDKPDSGNVYLVLDDWLKIPMDYQSAKLINDMRVKLNWLVLKRIKYQGTCFTEEDNELINVITKVLSEEDRELGLKHPAIGPLECQRERYTNRPNYYKGQSHNGSGSRYFSQGSNSKPGNYSNGYNREARSWRDESRSFSQETHSTYTRYNRTPDVYNQGATRRNTHNFSQERNSNYPRSNRNPEGYNQGAARRSNTHYFPQGSTSTAGDYNSGYNQGARSWRDESHSFSQERNSNFTGFTTRTPDGYNQGAARRSNTHNYSQERNSNYPRTNRNPEGYNQGAARHSNTQNYSQGYY